MRGQYIYKPLDKGKFIQLQSMHSKGPHENQKNKEHDLSGKYVLISKNFYYFGSTPIEPPPFFYELKVSRGHKNKFPTVMVKEFINFIKKFKKGVNASPTQWPPK